MRAAVCIALPLLIGCVKPLAPQDVTRFHSAQSQALSIYRDPTAGPLPHQRARLIFCLIEMSLQSAKAAAYDSKGAIECPKGG